MIDPVKSVSVVICTKDRAESLEQTLSAVQNVRIPEGWTVEIIVVDNGSRDRTKSVVEDAGSRSAGMGLTYIREDLPGLARARNTALDASRSRIVLFTDDDVRPSPEWLCTHVDAFRDAKVSAVQGPVRVVFEGDPPAWYHPESHGGFAATDHGPDPIVPYRRNLVGANMSMLRRRAQEVGGFSVMLGAGASGKFEDDDMSIRLRKAGYVQKYEPDAWVNHHVLAERITPKQFKRECVQLGLSLYVAACFYGTHEINGVIFNYLKWSWRRLKYEAKARVRGGRPVLPQEEMFHAMAWGSAYGKLLGRRRLRRRYLGECGVPMMAMDKDDGNE